MDSNRFSSWFGQNGEKWLGGLIGLLIALVVLEFGILKTIFVALCVVIGVYIGTQRETRERLSKLVQELFSKDR